MMSTIRTPNFTTVALIALIAIICLPTWATAQDTPYSPRQVPRSKLIDAGDFSKSPIQLPWTAVRISTLSNTYGSLDFEHLLDESFDEVMEYFRSNYKAQKPVVSISSDVVRYSKVSELLVRGMDQGQSKSQITLGAPGLPRHFLINIERHGNQTKLIVVNSTHTQEFSGVMPARAPFRPAGAKPIAFRWN